MLVGLTGNFGTGKSTVLKMLERLGAVTINSDDIVRDLYGLKEIQQEVLDIFGKDIMSDYVIDKKKIANLIFNSNILRGKLEVLLHNYVLSEIDALSKDNPEKVVVAEIPLLFESGHDDKVDHIVLLTCSEKTIFNRLRHKGFTDDEIKARLASQIPDSEKSARADDVIETDKGLEEVSKDIKQLYHKLVQSAR